MTRPATITSVQAVPVILTPPPMPVRLTTRGRQICAGVAVACLAVLAAAVYLAPDPAGYGTTGRLGMATCAFPRQFGLPCGACGMTTAFGYAVRLDFPRAFWAQPMGLLLAVATAVTFWGASYAACTGRPVHRFVERLLPRGGWGTLGVWGIALGIAAWGWKILLTFAGVAGTG